MIFKSYISKAIVGISILIFLFNIIIGCATTTEIRKENEHIRKALHESKTVWTKKQFNIESVSASSQDMVVTGNVTLTTTLATETSYKRVKYYDEVKHKIRKLTVIEEYFANFSDPKVNKGEACILGPIVVPIILAFLPFEILTGHPLGRKYKDLGVVSIETRQEEFPGYDTVLSNYYTEDSKAINIPLVLQSSDILFGYQQTKRFETTTDSKGNFSIPFILPKNIATHDQAKNLAMDKLRSIFINERLARQFLNSIDPTQRAITLVQVSTNATSLYNQREAPFITEDSREVEIWGVYLSQDLLNEALRKYLRDIALSSINSELKTVTIEIKDNISHSNLNEYVEIEADFVAGVSKDTLRNQMTATLRNYVQPAYIMQYLPSYSDLPDILRLPENFIISKARTFKINVPATYQIKAIHPEYVFLEGQKEFTSHDTKASIYMEEKGSKHRVSIEKGSTGGKIE